MGGGGGLKVNAAFALINCNLNEVVHADNDGERRWNFVREKSRPDCLQSEFVVNCRAAYFLAANQSVCLRSYIPRGARHM
jgi:hypothetical protein